MDFAHYTLTDDSAVHPLALTFGAESSEMMEAAEAYERRKDDIERRTEEFFRNVRICNDIWFVCFLDGTGSMDPCLKAVKQALEKMVRRLSKEYPSATIKVAAVIYRDPLESGPDKSPDGMHSVLRFGDVSAFSSFMKGVQAMGGGDEAEDVAGGLELALPLLDAVPSTDTCFFAHVSDSYAHGLGDDDAGGDNHNTQEQRDRLSDALEKLATHVNRMESFEYHYFIPRRSPSSTVSRAVQNYKNVFAEKLPDPALVGDVFKLCSCDDLEQTFMNSVFTSISAMSVAAGGRKVGRIDPFAPSMEILTHNDFFAPLGLNLHLPPEKDAVLEMTASGVRDSIAFSGLRVQRAQFPTRPHFQRDLCAYADEAKTLPFFHKGFYGFSQHLVASGLGKRTFEASISRSSDVVVFIHPTPMGRGRERTVCNGIVWSNLDPDVKKKLVSMGTDDVDDVVKLLTCSKGATHEQTRAVFKFDMLGVSDIECKIAVHTVGLWLEAMFNRVVGRMDVALPTIEVLSPIVIEFDDDVRCKKPGKHFFLKTKKLAGAKVLGELALHGEFMKYVNNDGARSPRMDGQDNESYSQREVVLDLLNLATAYWTNFTMVLTDLQGVYDDDKKLFVLTDLAIAAKNPMAFDQTTNLGKPAVRKVICEAHHHAKNDAGTVYDEFLTKSGIPRHAFER